MAEPTSLILTQNANDSMQKDGRCLVKSLNKVHQQQRESFDTSYTIPF